MSVASFSRKDFHVVEIRGGEGMHTRIIDALSIFYNDVLPKTLMRLTSVSSKLCTKYAYVDSEISTMRVNIIRTTYFQRTNITIPVRDFTNKKSFEITEQYSWCLVIEAGARIFEKRIHSSVNTKYLTLMLHATSFGCIH